MQVALRTLRVATKAPDAPLLRLPKPGMPRVLRMPRWVPVTGRDVAVDAEARLLCSLSRQPHARDVRIGDGPQDVLRSIDMPAAASAPPGAPRVVMLHGYGAGGAYFWRNLEGLGQHFNVSVVEWLGMGVSGRPAFTPRTPEEAEAWFVDSLEAWRAASGIDEPFILVGHSMGGYLASVYAERYPQRVSKLVLVCPGGMHEAPAGDGPRALMRRAIRNDLNTANVPCANGLASVLAAALQPLWNAGTTPMDLLRAMGPASRGLAAKYATSMLARPLPPNEAAALSHYLWATTTCTRSSEAALRHLFEFGGFARRGASVEARLSRMATPVTLIAGASDWLLPPAAAEAAAARIRSARSTPSRVRVEVLPGKHFPYMEAPAEFAEAVARAAAGAPAPARHADVLQPRLERAPSSGAAAAAA